MTELADKQNDESERFGPYVSERLMRARIAFAESLIKRPVNMPLEEARAIRDLLVRQFNEILDHAETWSEQS